MDITVLGIDLGKTWSASRECPRIGLEFSASDSLAGRRSGSNEGIAVHGRAEGVHHQAERGWHAGGGDLPQGRDQPGDLLQLEKKYSGMMPSEMKRLRELEHENARLKKLLAEAHLDKAMLQEVAKGNF